MTPQDIVDRALAASRTTACQVIVRTSQAANLRWAGNTMTTNGVTRTEGVSVIAIDGTAVGTVSRSHVEPGDIEDLVRAAEHAAVDNGPAEDAAPLVEGTAAADWLEPSGETSIRALEGVATGLRDAFAQSASERRLLYGYAEHAVSTTYLGTSTGVRLRHAQPGGVLELTGRSDDGTSSAWSGQPLRTGTDADVAAALADVRRRLDWSRRRIELPAGRYETVLPPSAVGDLMVYLLMSAGGRDAFDGRSVFSKPGGGTRVGEQLSSLPVRLHSAPDLPGWEAEPFVLTGSSGPTTSVFDNGLPLQPTDWVRGGRLAALIQSRHSAAVTGAEVTPAIGNLALTLDAAAATTEDMVASMKRGLLLTALWYIRSVDPQTLLLTGLTRDGVFLVQDGEIVGSVGNYRFNESPVDLLSRCTEVGRSVPALPRELSGSVATVMPPMRVPDFNMSSASDAS